MAAVRGVRDPEFTLDQLGPRVAIERPAIGQHEEILYIEPGRHRLDRPVVLRHRQMLPFRRHLIKDLREDQDWWVRRDSNPRPTD